MDRVYMICTSVAYMLLTTHQVSLAHPNMATALHSACEHNDDDNDDDDDDDERRRTTTTTTTTTNDDDG